MSGPQKSQMEIVEILGPSDQGHQKPYRCRAEDGNIYYVKGRQTNRSSLWNELLCAHLGKALSLNIPNFEIVYVSADLLQEVDRSWRDLGEGLAFASQQHPSTAWLELSMTPLVPVAVQRDVLIFDWWVRNSDRLTHNANLLWDTSEKELVVIDHNLAFDRDFSPAVFFQHHIFADQWASVMGDIAVQAELSGRLAEVFQTCFADACDNVPPEWHWENPECDVPANVDLSAIRAQLARCETPELWRMV